MRRSLHLLLIAVLGLVLAACAVGAEPPAPTDEPATEVVEAARPTRRPATDRPTRERPPATATAAPEPTLGPTPEAAPSPEPTPSAPRTTPTEVFVIPPDRPEAVGRAPLPDIGVVGMDLQKEAEAF